MTESHRQNSPISPFLRCAHTIHRLDNLSALSHLMLHAAHPRTTNRQPSHSLAARCRNPRLFSISAALIRYSHRPFDSSIPTHPSLSRFSSKSKVVRTFSGCEIVREKLSYLSPISERPKSESFLQRLRLKVACYSSPAI
ncbi:unnamed protein product [Microthlaspi erraticum]|uniref:Uncharacterized protein n=1 Tax=Microthlaspi erraticum TaxID=1685480 RepID=A0A6D2HKM4_9BRAS|nr:unnamed protein product [Microthlaspi erraticum]